MLTTTEKLEGGKEVMKVPAKGKKSTALWEG